MKNKKEILFHYLNEIISCTKFIMYFFAIISISIYLWGFISGNEDLMNRAEWILPGFLLIYPLFLYGAIIKHEKKKTKWAYYMLYIITYLLLVLYCGLVYDTQLFYYRIYFLQFAYLLMLYVAIMSNYEKNPGISEKTVRNGILLLTYPIAISVIENIKFMSANINV